MRQNPNKEVSQMRSVCITLALVIAVLTNAYIWLTVLT